MVFYTVFYDRLCQLHCHLCHGFFSNPQSDVEFFWNTLCEIQNVLSQKQPWIFLLMQQDDRKKESCRINPGLFVGREPELLCRRWWVFNSWFDADMWTSNVFSCIVQKKCTLLVPSLGRQVPPAWSEYMYGQSEFPKSYRNHSPISACFIQNSLNSKEFYFVLFVRNERDPPISLAEKMNANWKATFFGSTSGNCGFWASA